MIQIIKEEAFLITYNDVQKIKYKETFGILTMFKVQVGYSKVE